MGDRANIVVAQDDIDGNPNRIFLYAHWDGSRLPVVLRDALTRGRSRWDDETYLTRIIFSEMTKGETPDSTTGFGIGLYPSDNSYNYLVVNCRERTVSAETPGGEVLGKVEFAQYIELANGELNEFRNNGRTYGGVGV